MADAPRLATCDQPPESVCRSTRTAERGVVVPVAPFAHVTFACESLALAAVHPLGAAGAEYAMPEMEAVPLAVAPEAYAPPALGQ